MNVIPDCAAVTPYRSATLLGFAAKAADRSFKESFGNMFAEAARAAGVAKSAHDVRKIAATTATENGATVAELEAIFGWQGGRMAALYTKEADRKRLSKGAMTKLDGSRTATPSPDEIVRAADEKRRDFSVKI